MQIIKTYPVEIEAQREQWLSLIEATRLKYEAIINPSGDLTALIAIRRPRTPREFADLQTSYLLEIEPIVKHLVYLEGFATISMVIEREQAA
ncbi:hypothetical protein FHT86_002169 [Rhizobium sp. BK313]|uniref:hypothetical protein n=1 Tax=Rhizobium sp. BK313 TaxID=2587081 RepID=UPI0016201342|nr:hypothetical protein [Rhizobium sp. BK313]MBB3453913.1 hypothetical protein [Rhizobium sp. BK313]